MATSNLQAGAPGGPVRRNACVACRRAKARCLNNDELIPCQRCHRLKQECVYSRQKPGRKTNAERAARAIRDSMSISTEEPSAGRVTHFVEPALSLGGMGASSNSDMPGFGSHPLTFEHLGSPQVAQNPAEHASPELPVKTDVRRLDIAELLDPDGSSRPEAGSSMPNRQAISMTQTPFNEMHDPVSVGYLTWVEAAHLVKLFHHHLAPAIALLDPQLHTGEYMRRTSIPLFTAVLAASSKFFRRDLYLVLAALATALLNKAATNGECDIGIVQGLLILTYWKHPSDCSGWMKVGMAIRFGYQMNWHIPRTGPLPDDEQEARRVLNPERTWYCLVCFDRSYADLFGLPHTIRTTEMGPAEAWARDHLHLNVGADMHLACSIDFFDIIDRLAASRMVQIKEYWEIFYTEIEQALNTRLRKWHSAPLVGLSQSEQTFLHWYNLNIVVFLKREAYSRGIGGPDIFVDILGTASQIIALIEQVASAGNLLYLQDTAACAISNVTRLLHGIYWQLSVPSQRVAIDLLKRVHRCCLAVANGENDTAPAFVARSTHRMLESINAQSRVQTRLPSPSDGPSSAEVNQPAFDLEEFLQLHNTEPSYQVTDDQYWVSLFGSSFNTDPSRSSGA